MVQTDISQLSKECNGWRETLHSLRDEFHQHQTTLQSAVPAQLSKEQQTELEHFQNQLHIQLINIHDLKQAVKLHDKQVGSQSSNEASGVESIAANHEELFSQYNLLQSTLNDLRSAFRNFVTNLSSKN